MDKSEINLLDLGNKSRSKSELYTLLTTECDMYLPPYKLCTVYFIADVQECRKKAFLIILIVTIICVGSLIK